MSNTIKFINVNDIKPNNKNPRVIKDKKFADLIKSIKEFPEMLQIRPIIINKQGKRRGWSKGSTCKSCKSKQGKRTRVYD